MAPSNVEIAARFDALEAAEHAARELRLAGFRQADIEVIGTPTVLDALAAKEERAYPARVVVRPGNRVLEAASILHHYGGADEPSESDQDDGSGQVEEAGETLELVEEQLVPRTRVVSVGEIRIHKTVVTEDRTLTVPIRREEIAVERLPRSRSAMGLARQSESFTEEEEGGQREEVAIEDGDGAGLASSLGADEELVRIELYEEELVIEKRPVVKEEILVRKRRVIENRQVSAQLQRELPVLESTGQAVIEDRAGIGSEPAKDS